MNPGSMRQITARTAALVMALAVAVPLHAVVYTLRADVTTINMPDSVAVTMWGFADDTSGPGAVTVPGPTLIVPPGDSVLTVRLKNSLTPAATGLPAGVPVSVVIPGQPSSAQPVRFSAGSPYEGRIRSLAPETPPDGSTIVEYTWNNVQPGTYLYRSGTSMQAQIQMGLYGTMKKDSSAGNAYPGQPYTREVTLFYSEIDPFFHAAVAADQYGPGKLVTSTFDYNPKYFLVNGQPYTQGQAPIPAGGSGDTILMRMLNAGLQSHVPMINAGMMTIIAEQGNPCRYPRQQYSSQVSAMGTVDVILTPPGNGLLPVYDRSLFLTTGAGQQGGMLVYLNVNTPAGTPISANDFYSTAEDSPLDVVPTGVLLNDIISNGSGGAMPGQLTAHLVSGPGKGTVTLNSSGGFRYVPDRDFFGRDSFVYRANASGVFGNDAVATIDVLPRADVPISRDDYARTGVNVPVLIDVLINDTDPDGGQLTINQVTAPRRGIAVIEGNAIRYSPNRNYRGTDVFQYSARNSAGLVGNMATVSVTMAPYSPPRAVPDRARTTVDTPVVINVLANDTDSDGVIDPSTVVIVSPPRSGQVSVASDGLVTFTPAPGYVGTMQFRYKVSDNHGLQSQSTSVQVTVSR